MTPATGTSVRLRPWQISLLLVLVCAALVGGFEWRRQRQSRSNQALLRRLPAQDEGIHVFVDVQALRSSGFLNVLAGAQPVEETEYRQFVEAAQFDYRQDLDVIVASFHGGDKRSFLLRGRFRWDQLRHYAVSQGASCINGYCDVETRRPGRWVSFYPVFPEVMSLAFSDNGYGASAANVVRPEPEDIYIPPQPFWVRIPARILNDPEALPAGARAFASALKGAIRLTLAIGPQGDNLEIEMIAVLPNIADAAAARAQLEIMTTYLARMIARAKQKPNPLDLSGILTHGKFDHQDRRVRGRWPVDRAFLEALAEGKVE